MLIDCYWKHKQKGNCKCTRFRTTSMFKTTVRRRRRVWRCVDGSSLRKWNWSSPTMISSRLTSSGRQWMRSIGAMWLQHRTSTSLKPCKMSTDALRSFLVLHLFLIFSSLLLRQSSDILWLCNTSAIHGWLFEDSYQDLPQTMFRFSESSFSNSSDVGFLFFFEIPPLQYLALARECIGYGEVTFPHCGCDARKEGHVIPSLGFNSFRLQACKDDGSVQVILGAFTYPVDLTLHKTLC